MIAFLLFILLLFPALSWAAFSVSGVGVPATVSGITSPASVSGVTSSYGADVTPPTLSSVIVGGNGTSITYTYNESVQCNPTSDCCDAFAVSWSSQGAISQTYVSGTGTGTVICTSNKTILSGETVTSGLDYTQPGNGIEDLAGNDLANISGKAVTNNSTQTPSSYACDSTTDADILCEDFDSNVLCYTGGPSNCRNTWTRTAGDGNDPANSNSGILGSFSTLRDLKLTRTSTAPISSITLTPFTTGYHSITTKIVDASSLPSGDIAEIYIVWDSTLTYALADLMVYNDAGTLRFRFTYLDSSGNEQVTTDESLAVSTGTWYSHRIKFKNSQTVGDVEWWIYYSGSWNQVTLTGATGGYTPEASIIRAQIGDNPLVMEFDTIKIDASAFSTGP